MWKWFILTNFYFYFFNGIGRAAILLEWLKFNPLEHLQLSELCSVKMLFLSHRKPHTVLIVRVKSPLFTWRTKSSLRWSYILAIRELLQEVDGGDLSESSREEFSVCQERLPATLYFQSHGWTFRWFQLQQKLHRPTTHFSARLLLKWDFQENKEDFTQTVTTESVGILSVMLLGAWT